MNTDTQSLHVTNTRESLDETETPTDIKTAVTVKM